MTTFLRVPDIVKKRAQTLLYADPERDWIMLMIVWLVLLAGIVVWNAFAFDTVANGGTIGTPVTNTAPVFSQTSLDAIHSIFANRAAEEAKYTSDVYHYSDPSL